MQFGVAVEGDHEYQNKPLWYTITVYQNDRSG